MRKTINQINQELKAIAEGMPQIHSYAWKDFLRAYKEVELNYPLMCCYYPSGALLDNQTDIQLTIVIADKIYKDWSNLNDVESDTLGICRSIFNIINRSTRWQRIGRVLSCNVTKFIERGGDEVAGHTMVFQLRLRDSNSLCDIPIFDYDFDSVYESTCQPVLIFKDGVLVDTVPSGGIYEYFSDVCLDATVENSDASYTETVSSGGTLVLPDITVTDSDGSTYTQPSVTDVFCTPNEIDVYINRILVAEDQTEDVLLGLFDQDGNELIFTQNENELTVNIPACEDVTLTLNGNEFLTVPSGDTQDIELLDQNGDPITPESVVDNVITVDIPLGGTNSAPLMKTGQTTSYRTGDDGDIQAGRDNSFFELDFLNFFGNNKRFTGVTGGYYDRATSQYKDVNGTVTTRSSAFPDNVVCDWSTFNKVTGEFLCYINDSEFIVNTLPNAISILASTTKAGLSGWRVGNINEAWNIYNWGLNLKTNYIEMYNVGYNFGFFTSTMADANGVQSLSALGSITNGLNINTSIRCLGVRTTNISEL